MKDILISIRPQWVEKIASGEKTIEIRKTRPKLEAPFKCLIYCTIARKNGQPLLFYKDGTVCFGDYREAFNCNADGEVDCYIGEGKVIGEFICDKITEYIAYKTDKDSKYCKNPFFYSCLPIQEMCLTIEQIENYGKGKTLYGWHTSDLKIYDKSKELSDFGQKCDGVCCNTAKKILCQKTKTLKSFDCDSKIPLTRPPQSWCYVEEEK